MKFINHFIMVQNYILNSKILTLGRKKLRHYIFGPMSIYFYMALTIHIPYQFIALLKNPEMVYQSCNIKTPNNNNKNNNRPLGHNTKTLTTTALVMLCQVPENLVFWNPPVDAHMTKNQVEISNTLSLDICDPLWVGYPTSWVTDPSLSVTITTVQLQCRLKLQPIVMLTTS